MQPNITSKTKKCIFDSRERDKRKTYSTCDFDHVDLKSSPR